MRSAIILALIFILSTFALAENIVILPVEPENQTLLPEPETPAADAPPFEQPLPEPTPPEEEISSSIFSTILNLVLNKISVVSGELVRIRAGLFYENNSPIVGEPLRFYVGDTKVGTQNTDESGSSIVTWDSSNLRPGVYIVGVDYVGNGQLQARRAEEQLTIQPREEPAAVVNEEQLTIPAQPSPSALTGAVVEENQPSTIQEEKQCIQIPYEIQQPIMGVCTDTYPKIVCDDYPTNTSCHETTEDITHSCVTGYETITQYKEECHTTALVINEHFAIPTTAYACSAIEEGSLITVTCDSKYDGDGNGECHSGESCLQYEIEGETISQKQRNSHDEFTKSDDSFFQEENDVEVRS